MTDVVVTVPKSMWDDWIDEGDLPGEPWTEMRSHFWLPPNNLPKITRGERVYVVAHGKLRGYAPLVEVEWICGMRDDRACLMRYDGAVAVTIPEPIRGFQGYRYRWWERDIEVPFPRWMIP